MIMRKMMRRSVVLLHCCYSWMMVPCSGRSSLRTESRRDIQDIIKTKLPTINEDSTELCFSAASASSSLHQNHHKSKNHRKRQQGQEQGILQHQVEMMIMRTSSSSSSSTGAAAAAANTNKGIKSSTSTTGGGSGRPHQPRRPFSLTDYYVHFILRFASRAARF